MKRTIKFAVATVMTVLCAVVMWSCSSKSEYDLDGQKNIPIIVEKTRVISCEVTLNTYEGTGVVMTRSAAIEHLDGKLVATSRHLMKIANATVEERTYSGTNTIEARGVLKPRYAKTLDSFKESNLRMSETTFEDGRVGYFINFADGTNHNFYYSFIVENSYDTDTIQVVNAQSGEVETLQRCINEIVNLEFLNMRKTDLQRDSAGWHAYSLIHVYSGRLSEGPNNGFTYEVNIPLVWVWKGKEEPEYPDTPTPIVWEDGDEGFDFVNDSTSQSWKYIIPILSDGTKGKPDRIAVLLKNTIVEPEYQIKTVEDFNWSELDMIPYDEVKAGDRYDKENKISVQPYMKSVKTRTNKCDAIFILKREGAPIYTDSLGGKHYLPERQWTAVDDGWNDSKLSPTDNYERLLLTSRIIGTFNEHSHPAKGEVELKKVKGEDIKIIGYSYPEDEKGIEAIVPNESYKTWRNQYTVFSNGKKEFNQKVSTTLYLKTVAPQKQTVTVDNWDINDLTAQDYKASRGESRADRQETGTFTITTWTKNYLTRTNKSEDKFVTTYDGTVKFVDKYENEVDFIALAVKQEDLGGVATLKDLMDQDGYERKLMTTSVAVTETHTSTSANHTAEVEFRKAKPEDPYVIQYDYKEFDIKPVIPNKQYYTYCTRYAVKSDGTSDNLGTIGTDLYVNVTEPAKQTITVQDWNINDQKATLGSAVPKGSRNDPQNEGVFRISKSEKSYTTRTNKSECIFVISYEGTVTFTDTFGKETAFKGITISASDNGGVATLKDLPEQGGLERKEMTSNITVTVNSTDNDNYNGIVEFRKAVEKEELLSWDKEQSLVPAGNGLWTSTTTIIYNWKLAGRKTEPISVNLDWSIVGEAKSHVILAEAKAPYKTFNEGGWGNPTKSYPSDGVTVYTYAKSYVEDYTNLNDKYTAKMSTASYSKVVDGKTIAFDFLSPSSMNISHASDNLVDGKRTTTEAGVTYDVYDHTGSVTATVSGNGKSQTQSAKDEKEIWVKHNDPATECKYKFVDATLVFNPNVSSGGKGAFHVCLAIKGESEWIIAVTRTYGSPNAADFDTYRFPFSQVPSNYKINSAIMWDGSWIPAYLSGIGQNWTYGGYNDQIVNMNMNLAETCGIKNFTGSSTAENTARLAYTHRVTNDGTLHVYNNKGGEVYSIK
jgi:hypothetical protein